MKLNPLNPEIDLTRGRPLVTQNRPLVTCRISQIRQMFSNARIYT